MQLALTSILFVLIISAVSATRKLVVFELTATGSLIFGNPRFGLTLYSLLTLPGTILHELSHWLVAELLRVPTGKITILPDREGEMGEERLGSVMTARSDPFRGFLIGLSPFVTGIIVLLILAKLLQNFWGVNPWWQIALIVYGMLVVGNSLLISREDRRYWPIIGIILILLIVVLSNLNLSLPTTTLTTMDSILNQTNLVLGIALFLNLSLLGVLFGVRYMVQKLTGKRVVTKRS